MSFIKEMDDGRGSELVGVMISDRQSADDPRLAAGQSTQFARCTILLRLGLIKD